VSLIKMSGINLFKPFKKLYLKKMQNQE